MKNNIPCQSIRLYQGDRLVDPADVDLLIIMGGPMNIYEETLYPWLIAEKKFIAQVINLKIPVLGICLGGQLIADLLGGRVTPAVFPEYGWHSVKRLCHDTGISCSELYSLLPETLMVFQWHQDTFSLPPGAIHLYFSEQCQNQGFIYGDRVIALQFHPELNEETIVTFVHSLQYQVGNEGQKKMSEEIIENIRNCSQGHIFIEIVMNHLLALPRYH